jgi:hypothetical protein
MAGDPATPAMQGKRASMHLRGMMPPQDDSPAARVSDGLRRISPLLHRLLRTARRHVRNMPRRPSANGCLPMRIIPAASSGGQAAEISRPDAARGAQQRGMDRQAAFVSSGCCC